MSELLLLHLRIELLLKRVWQLLHEVRDVLVLLPMIVVDGAHQLVEQLAIHAVLDLDVVKGGDLLFELRISLVDALDDSRESPS